MELHGLDGKLELDGAGLTFTRSKFRAAGRGGATVHQVPWTAVQKAEVVKGALRVRVAGVAATKLASGDPHAVVLKRKQEPEAEHVAAEVSRRAAGDAARPVETEPVRATAVPAQAVAAPSAGVPTWVQRGSTLADRARGFALVMESITLFVQIVLIIAVLVGAAFIVGAIVL